MDDSNDGIVSVSMYAVQLRMRTSLSPVPRVPMAPVSAASAEPPDPELPVPDRAIAPSAPTATMPPPISSERRLNRLSFLGGASDGVAGALLPSSAACTSSTSVVVAPMTADVPAMTYAASGGQAVHISSPTRT